MKKYISGLITGMIIMVAIGSFAISTVGYKVFVDGKEVTAEKINYNGRTYLEMRQVAEMLGANVNWDGKTANIYSKDYVTPVPDVGAKEVKLYIDGKEQVLDDPLTKFMAYVKNGHLMINKFVLDAIVPTNTIKTEYKSEFKGKYVSYFLDKNYYVVNGEQNPLNEKTIFTNGYVFMEADPIIKEMNISIKFENDTVIATR